MSSVKRANRRGDFHSHSKQNNSIRRENIDTTFFSASTANFLALAPLAVRSIRMLVLIIKTSSSCVGTSVQSFQTVWNAFQTAFIIFTSIPAFLKSTAGPARTSVSRLWFVFLAATLKCDVVSRLFRRKAKVHRPTKMLFVLLFV